MSLAISLFVSHWFLPQSASARFKAGFSDISISITDTKYGMPLIMITPLQPGTEIGATFLKKDKEKAFHSVDGTACFYHHSLISNAFYLGGRYNYPLKIKNPLGIDLHTGIGFLFSAYPGAGYANITSGIRIQPGNRFLIASVSKVSTATAVFSCIEEGVLSLEDPVNKCIDGKAGYGLYLSQGEYGSVL